MATAQIQAALDYSEIADRVVITGDVIDYISHGAYYTEIMCDDGKVIPQYTMNGGFYTFGTATKITVK